MLFITLRPGTRPGFVEIAFPEKPDRADIAELKAAGFRYVPRGPHWYGRADKAPASFAQGVAVLKSLVSA